MPKSEAIWYVGEGRTELRAVTLPATGVKVTALYSGISRGTERLVFQGGVPASEHQRMRCPHQEGDFPFPVKYGYALVGKTETGEHAFVLHPHQREVVVGSEWLNILPKDLPPRRACLAANMETALNVVWDAHVAAGDRVVIVGGGVLGLLIAGIAARIPGTAVTVSDIDASRAAAAQKMGAAFATTPPRDQDIVIHTSASAAGLAVALSCAGTEARVVEASWYGDKAIAAPLGEAFHSRRLQLISSQVGSIPASHRARWSHARRMAMALDLLRDERFDALITGEIAFADAPEKIPNVLAGNAAGLMTLIRYS